MPLLRAIKRRGRYPLLWRSGKRNGKRCIQSGDINAFPYMRSLAGDTMKRLAMRKLRCAADVTQCVRNYDPQAEWTAIALIRGPTMTMGSYFAIFAPFREYAAVCDSQL